MKILEVIPLALPEIHLIRFARFRDHRGYFTENMKASDLVNQAPLEILRGYQFPQINESFSLAGTVRGLHFQWNPFQGKLVRPIFGHLLDFILDIRLNSPNFGKIIGCDMPNSPERDYSEWIWIPPGFAHGALFPQDSMIEYLCTSEYSPGCEGCISPLANDLDWSWCEPALHSIYQEVCHTSDKLTEKDRNGWTLQQWTTQSTAQQFTYPMPPTC